MKHPWNKCLIWLTQTKVEGYQKMSLKNYLMDQLYQIRNGTNSSMYWIRMGMESYPTKNLKKWWLNLYVDNIQFSNSSSISTESGSVFVSSSNNLIPFRDTNWFFNLMTSASSLKRDLRHFMASLASEVSPFKFSVMSGRTFYFIKACFRGFFLRDNLSA